MFIYSHIRFWIAVAATAAASPLAAQTLTLREALDRADGGAYGNRMAAARAATGRADALQPLRGILPSVRIEGGWMRTTDPIGAFGTTLRQRAVTPAAFAPAALNDPAPRSDVTAALVIEQPLLNLDAWAGRRAAGRAAEAADARQRWTREQTRVTVIRAYYGAVLAAERVGTLEAAARAAHDHVRQAQAMAGEGLVTRSDVLLASVRAGEVDAELVRSRADATQARRSLAVLTGAPRDTLAALPGQLPAADRIRMLAADTLPERPRADVEAADAMLAAAGAGRAHARAMVLPRLNGFARYDWHARSAPFGGTPMWTIGVMASFSPFTGGAGLADRRAADGRQAEARAGAEATAAQADLEVAQYRSDREVAGLRLALAEAAVAQSAEAHRIVARKYEGGLATVVELLDAAAIDTQTRLRFAAARYDAIVADAALRTALGQPLDALARLDN